MRARRLGAVGALVAYIATIPAANMAVTHFGVVPVGLGYLAPAGVYLVGIALVLRDLARETAGRWPVAAAVLVGAALSYWLASPALATASAAAFALSEGLDFMVYEPLRKRGLLTAMVVSNLVGMLADSLVFLTLAFGSLQFLPGQLLGKAWMTAAAVAVIAGRRRLATI
ncbi:VUT family protein [Streptomyces sp. CB03911]|uniref:VUT family protein n=1 Tax=Streptomyces sp. CB03911 TaxID=1804758 RepID=UPI00093A1712|nr:VUT family protein [Streptomyces sp. CB03911]OKI26138.1 beta-carotene 15,15'-monooxygenase [Streptomyces sp. CB03911]